MQLRDRSTVGRRSQLRPVSTLQQQRIAHHRHRAQRHRRAGDHRVQQAERRERYAEHVVDEREEQVLPDLASVARDSAIASTTLIRSSRMSVMSAALDRDVGAGARWRSSRRPRRAPARRSRRRRPCRPCGLRASAPSTRAALSLRQHLGFEARDAGFARDGRRRARVVAGQHDDLDAERPQRSTAARDVGRSASAIAIRPMRVLSCATSTTVLPCVLQRSASAPRIERDAVVGA